MVEGERIVFKLSKTIWNKCRERDLKLLEKLEAKEAELAHHKTIVQALIASSSSTITSHNICSTCTKLSLECVCKKTGDETAEPLLPIKIPGKRGRKRKLSEDKLTHQSLLSHLIRLRDTLSNEELDSYLPCDEYESYFTMIPSLTRRELINHMISVRVEFVQRLMRPIIQKFISHPRNGDVFNHPVDPVALGLRDYFQKISTPMDLGTIRCNLLQGDYYSIEECIKDINLVFNNAISYNPSTHVIHQNAIQLRQEFHEEVNTLEDRLTKEEEKKNQHCCDVCEGSLCLVCGERCLKLEPTILVCYGPCGQRIKKQSTFFIAPDGGLLWCQKCYTAANSVIVESYEADHSPLYKKDLLKRKFDEEAVETWLNCSTCSRRIHQACGLYNDLHDSSALVAKSGAPLLFQCPLCKLNISLDSTPMRSHHSTNKKWRVESQINQDRNIEPMGPDSGPHLSVSFSQKDSIQIIHQAQSIQSQRTGSSDTSDESMDMHDRFVEQIVFQDEDSDIEVAPNTEEDDSMCVVTDIDGDFEEDDEAEIVEEQKSISERTAISSDCASLIDEIVDEIFHSKRSTGRPRKSKVPVISRAPTEQWKASSLPRTKLSDFIESMVQHKLDQSGFGDVMKSITIRMTSNSYHNFEVPEVIVNNLPTSDGYHVNPFLYYKQKCILLFQNIDGIDVCLFCLYVQEFDEHCPEPNRSKVYIAYLDSVEYFRPRCVRTTVYHEILVAYMVWCKARGFKQCHIWACPPQRGDNFIFWCHNPQQRNPSRDRLNSWYNAMLARANQLGILKSIDTLWSTYFSSYGKRDELSQRTASKNSFVAKNSVLVAAKTGANITSDVTPPICPPIFEGDFWVNESARVYRLVQARSKGIDGQDKNINLRKCRDILKQLMSKPIAAAFNQPVDPVLLNIPDYPSIVTSPMDLGTVRSKLRTNQYKTILDYAKDIRLTFNNAMLYNPQSHPIHSFAQKLLEDFEQSLYDIVSERLGEMMSPSTNIDLTLETYPLCGFLKNSNTTSKNTSNLNTELEKETLCLTRRVSFVESDCKRECDSSLNVCLDLNLETPEDDDYNIESKQNGEIEDPDVLPGLSRQDSTESVLSINDWPRRPDHTTSHVCLSSDIQCNGERKLFEKSQLGQKGVMALMSELSRNVCRLKDDMYVITFHEASTVDCALHPCPTHNFAQSDDVSTKIVETCSIRGGKGKGKGLSVIGTYSHSSKVSKVQETEKISATCLALLSHLKSDTSDPDDALYSPFIDSRSTFLEMCQFRHYQFDSLRRAKYSSMMLLYHLLYPHSRYTRPVCAECKAMITTVRWHCTLCLDSHYDVCSNCLHIANQNHEHHDLTPVRLTYI